MKKQVLTTAALAISALASPSVYAGVDWFGGWEIGDFYVGGEAGYSSDSGVSSGQFSGITPADIYNRQGHGRQVGGRDVFGYRHMIRDDYSVGIEFGYGDYGTQDLARGINSNSQGTAPVIRLHYTGGDAMLVGNYHRGDHVVSLKLGAGRVKNDLTYHDWDTTADQFHTRANVETRFKGALGYEYRVKDQVGLTASVSRFYGDTVDTYQTYPNVGIYKNTPNGVPTISTAMVGVQLYF